MEIERQFLVRPGHLPDLTDIPCSRISQGYISFSPEIRLREIDGRQFLLTVKTGTGLVREEFEAALSESDWRRLSTKIENNRLEKTRYHIPLPGGFTAELDCFSGHLDGLQYAEVEFPSEEAAAAFTPPDWFGQEITERADFSSQLLTELSGFTDLCRHFPELFG